MAKGDYRHHAVPVFLEMCIESMMATIGRREIKGSFWLLSFVVCTIPRCRKYLGAMEDSGFEFSETLHHVEQQHSHTRPTTIVQRPYCIR